MKKLPYIWDYDLDEDKLNNILTGKLCIGRLDQKWAILRVIEYAPYEESIRLIGYDNIVQWWDQIRDQVRSVSRKRGFDFLVKWIIKNHPELLTPGAHE